MKSKSPKYLIKVRTDFLTFGKHKGRTIQYILDEEPSYIIWLVEEDIVEIPDDIYQEAQELDGSGYEDFHPHSYWRPWEDD